MESGTQSQRQSYTRHNVFISSTGIDLAQHRQKVIDTVLRFGLFPVAMEQFGAQGAGDPVSVSTDILAKCDVYLGLVGWRYGHVPPDETRSVTQLEYIEARKRGLPCYLFLADPATDAPDGPDALFPAAVRDPEHLPQLLAFRDLLQQSVVDYFTTPDDLARKIAPPLSQYLVETLEQEQEKARAAQAQRVPPVRKKLLGLVRSIWIGGMLEKSLADATFIPLGLAERPDLVQSPWQDVIQDVGRPAGPLPAGTTITQVYDDENDVLVIVGEPGAGKTTLLLALTNDLLQRAAQDAQLPLPVVFNLSTWATKRQPLGEWFVDELVAKYQLPRTLSRALVDGEQMLPMLDGLDEVGNEQRAACVAAINAYRHQQLRVPVVVGSRVAEYEALGTKIVGGRAVQVQPLTAAQVTEYLASSKSELAMLQDLIHQDPAFEEVVRNPLMLSIIKRAYEGRAIPLDASSSVEGQKQQIFTDYVERMLQRRQVEHQYTPDQTKEWLNWLARQLQARHQSIFFLERLQMDWLAKTLAYKVYFSLTFGLVTLLITILANTIFFQDWLVGIELGLLDAGLATLFGWLVMNGGLQSRKNKAAIASDEGARRPRSRFMRFLAASLKNRLFYLAILCGVLDGAMVHLLVGDLYASNHGLLFGAFFVVMGSFSQEIHPAELLTWSWRSVREHALPTMLICLAVGLLLGIENAYPFYNQPSVLNTLAFNTSEGFAFGIVLMLLRGYSRNTLDSKQVIRPNQGIRNSLSNSTRLGLYAGISFAFVVFLFYGYIMSNVLTPGYAYEIPANSYIRNTGTFGVGLGYMFWLINGGFAVLQHYVLRFTLWRRHTIPVRYTRFLDFANERILLRKIGGGYAYVHKLLLEYFADLSDEPGARAHPVKKQIR